MNSRSWALLLIAVSAIVSSSDVVAASRADREARARTVVYTESNPSLSIWMTDTPDPVSVGQELTYTMVVWNRPPTDEATDVMLTNTLPEGVELVLTVSSQGACAESGDKVTCALGNLLPGDRAKVSIVLVPTSEGFIKNTALVMVRDEDVYPPDNMTTEYTTVVARGSVPLAASAASGAIRRAIDDAVVVGTAPTLRAVPSSAGPASGASDSGRMALDAVEGLFRLMHQKDARIDELEERLATIEKDVAGKGLMGDLWPRSSAALPWLAGGAVLGVVLVLSMRGRRTRKRSRA